MEKHEAETALHPEAWLALATREECITVRDIAARCARRGLSRARAREEGGTFDFESASTESHVEDSPTRQPQPEGHLPER